jgi:hypothetical protein
MLCQGIFYEQSVEDTLYFASRSCTYGSKSLDSVVPELLNLGIPNTTQDIYVVEQSNMTALYSLNYIQGSLSLRRKIHRLKHGVRLTVITRAATFFP